MKTILLDLDGVINTYEGKYIDDYIPPLKVGAKDFLAELSREYRILIFTTRDIKQVQQWLNCYDCSKYIDKITNHKEPAYLIIDDRCITFDGKFENIKSQIKIFKPWYKQ